MNDDDDHKCVYQDARETLLAGGCHMWQPTRATDTCTHMCPFTSVLVSQLVIRIPPFRLGKQSPGCILLME